MKQPKYLKATFSRLHLYIFPKFFISKIWVAKVEVGLICKFTHVYNTQKIEGNLTRVFSTGNLSLDHAKLVCYLQVWSLTEGSCLMTLTGHHDAVTCLNLTFDSRKVISGSLDHNLKFWDLLTGKVIMHWQMITKATVYLFWEFVAFPCE